MTMVNGAFEQSDLGKETKYFVKILRYIVKKNKSPSGLWFPKVLGAFTLKSLNKPTSVSTLKYWEDF